MPSGVDATIAALDKRSGKVLWKTKLAEGYRAQGYAAISLSVVGGIRQYIAFTAKSIVGLAAVDGKLLWEYDGLTSNIANSHSPIPRDDLILASNGYNTGISLLQLERKGDQVVAHERYNIHLPLGPFQDTVVWTANLAYAFQSGRFLCLEVNTGKILWGPITAPHKGNSSALWADERLYLRHADGAVTLMEATKTGPSVKGALVLQDAVASAGATAPVIAGRRLFLRDNNRLFCYDIRDDALKHPANSASKSTIVLNAREQAGALPSATVSKTKVPDAVYVPTPQEVVVKMLELAAPRKSDVVTDLGSGDGRIVITAARKYGAKAIGYELDQRLVDLSREKVAEEKLGQLVTINLQAIFTVDLKTINVVAVFLYPQLLERLLPQFDLLPSGSRIVSHQLSQNLRALLAARAGCEARTGPGSNCAARLPPERRATASR